MKTSGRLTTSERDEVSIERAGMCALRPDRPSIHGGRVRPPPRTRKSPAFCRPSASRVRLLPAVRPPARRLDTPAPINARADGLRAKQTALCLLAFWGRARGNRAGSRRLSDPLRISVMKTRAIPLVV